MNINIIFFVKISNKPQYTIYADIMNICVYFYIFIKTLFARELPGTG